MISMNCTDTPGDMNFKGIGGVGGTRHPKISYPDGIKGFSTKSGSWLDSITINGKDGS